MRNNSMNVIDKVVNTGLCCSCGLCAGVCPTNALEMEIQENGDLAPSCANEKCLDECGLCLNVCPFESGIYNPRELNERLYGKESSTGSSYDPNIGWFLDCFVGYRKDPDLRRLSASGGLLTWCLEDLLTNGLVSKVATVRFAPGKEGYFEFFSASTVSELRSAAGSVYQPVSISSVIKEIRHSENEIWAVVGVPCLCAAVQRAKPILKDKVKFVFGLACGMYQNVFYTDLLLAESGINKDEVASISYRVKSDIGPANNYGFQATDIKGKIGKLIPYKGLPYYLGKHAFFRQNACNFCMDVFAEAADACFMDAWLPCFRLVPEGTSLIVIRNKNLSELFLQDESYAEIQVNKIDLDEIVQSQKGHVRRKREIINIRNKTNNYKNNNKILFLIERINWLTQSYLQHTSKFVWKKVVVYNSNEKDFWREIWYLRFIVYLNEVINKNINRIMKIISKYIKG